MGYTEDGPSDFADSDVFVPEPIHRFTIRGRDFTVRNLYDFPFEEFISLRKLVQRAQEMLPDVTTEDEEKLLACAGIMRELIARLVPEFRGSVETVKRLSFKDTSTVYGHVLFALAKAVEKENADRPLEPTPEATNQPA